MARSGWTIYLRITRQGHYIGLTNRLGRRRREHRSQADPLAQLHVVRSGIGTREEAEVWERYYLSKLVRLAEQRPELGIRVLNKRKLPKKSGHVRGCRSFSPRR